jgi:hypothetical protein
VKGTATTEPRFGAIRYEMTRLRPAGWGAILALALSLLFSSVASAVPVHPPLVGENLSGFNHACGVATDSEGDVYVSSAGDSKVKVFNPAHNELESISNANEPCGLAVDGNGNLYVSEKATGNVVKYAPGAYPFSGAPGYDPPATIDPSGKAKGIAVDPVDDRLYVAEGTAIATYDAAGISGPSVGAGELKKATGVAASSVSATLHVSVADAEGDRLKLFSGPELAMLKLRQTIEGVDQDRNPGTPDQKFGFGSADAYLSAEPGSGHLFVYDDAHSVVDELEASGQFLDQISNPGFADAEPTAVAAYPQRDETQFLKISAVGGSFTLSFEGQTTAPISVGGTGEEPTAAEVRQALEVLSTVEPGSVAVSGGYVSSPQAGSYAISFVESLGGRGVPQLEADGSGLTGGSSTATVTTDVQGSGPGRIYVTSGAAAAAKALAFGPLPPPSRPPRPDLSLGVKNACGVAIDSFGNRYVAADKFIYVYGTSGSEPLTKIEDPNPERGPCTLAVDSLGHVYGLDGNDQASGGGRVVYFTPESFPPQSGTKYSGPTVVATATDFSNPSLPLSAFGLNPLSDHVFVSQVNQTIEFDSAANESKVLNASFASGLGLNGRAGIAVYGPTGDVYFLDRIVGGIVIVDSSGEEVLARVRGVGSPKGQFGVGRPSSFAVDQSNGHMLIFSEARGVAEEYDASGAFITQFSAFKDVPAPSGVAVDNSGGVNDGSVFVAFLKDVSAFGPLAYGEPPVVATGNASGVGGGNATLNGTVNPRGFEAEDCHFQYTTEADYEANEFSAAASAPCAESLAEIGKGTSPVAVHADLSGLDPDGRYRFRLVAENKYGAGEGAANLFGPPLFTPRSALPIFYVEATVRANVDPSGLATKYRVEYGTGESYGNSTSAVEIGPGAGPTDVAVHLFGLAEGTTYHYRFVVENDAKTVEGIDQVLTTRERAPAQACPNTEFRIGHSAGLPDCRAYELVSPADTRGTSPYAFADSNTWMVTPYGPSAGNSLAFFINGTLPGFEGNGRVDVYRALRGAGAHPSGGWSSTLFAPSYAQVGGGEPRLTVGAFDQQYSIWSFTPSEVVEGTLPGGTYLRTPAGLELLGQGSLGTDPKAAGRFLAAGAAHAIFTSKAHLEEAAAPEGTEAIYDRTPGGTEVVSVAPDGSPFGGGEGASYVASTEDGASVLFRVGGALYLRRGQETVQVATGASTFAGISSDGQRVLYAVGPGATPATLLSCDLAGGACAGPEAAQAPTVIAPQSIFVNVSADGSRAYFSSEEALTGGEENEAGEVAEAGEDNLYLWEAAGESTHFVARLDPSDLEANGFGSLTSLANWTQGVGPGLNGLSGRANSPTSSTPSGSALVFQSHAQLTPYDNEGRTEVYRFDSVGSTEQLSCVSCDPSGTPAGADAHLQSTEGNDPAAATTLIPNLSEGGKRVFFESDDRLLPDDANAFRDVYEWQTKGTGGCKRPSGCLALISPGQGEHDNFLYSVTPDGHDVFFRTQEKLVGSDLPGSTSIYDARVDGGIPDPPENAPCQGDACQGTGSIPPVLPSAPSATLEEGGNVDETAKQSCAKGQRKVRKAGKTRCVKPHKHKHKRHAKKRRTNAKGRAHR